MSRNDKNHENIMQENNVLTESADDKNINPKQRTVMHNQASDSKHKNISDESDARAFNDKE